MGRIIYWGLSMVMLLMVSISQAWSKTPSNTINNIGGIYLTSDDYLKDSISVRVDFSKREKLYFDNFFIRPYISISKRNQKVRYYKQDIFAVKTPKGEVYRFYNDNAYRIDERETICIYSRQENVQVLSPYNRLPRYAKYQRKTSCFFSLRPDSPVYPLSPDNLLIAMAHENNPAFQHLDQLLKDSTDLTVYDQQAGMFRVNVLLKRAVR